MIRLRPPLPRSPFWRSCVVLALAAGATLSANPESAPAAAAEAHAHPATPPAASAPSDLHGPAGAAPASDSPLVDVAPVIIVKNAPPSQADDEIRSLLKLGGIMTDRGDYDAAEIAFRQVMRSSAAPDADVKTALLGLARMHRRQGALTKATAIYEKYLKTFPGDDRTPDVLLDLGRTVRALGVYDLAISRFYNVINSTLKLSDEGFEHYQLLAKTAQFEIAETHFQAGRFEEAAKFFARLRLLDLAPVDRARAHFKAAYAQHLQGNNEASVATLRAFIELSPDDENNPEARYLLAVGLRAVNRRQEALVVTLDLLRVEKTRLAADPKRWAYWQRRTGNQLANDFYESGDTLNAHAIYASLAELSIEPAWRLPILYQIGLCHERLGNIERARSTYQGIIDTAGTAAVADAADLARLATWRLAQLEWRDQVGRKVSLLFDTTTGRMPTTAAITPPPPTAILP